MESKLRKCVRPEKKLHFKTVYTTTKVNFFTNNKDRTPLGFKANVVYRFTCPGCSAQYIGKTDRNLHERCIEHATTKDSAIHNHLVTCKNLYDINAMMRFGIELNDSDQRISRINCVESNVKIIDSSTNWNILLLKEALYIKRESPSLNNGLKASRDLFLFS